MAAARPLLEEDDKGELARKAMRRTQTANILGDVNEVSETFESCSVMLILALSHSGSGSRFSAMLSGSLSVLD